MLVSEWLEHVNDALRGTDEDAPTLGTIDANLWLRTLNRKKNELYENVKVLWNETWKSTAPNEPGTVATTGTTTLTGTGTFFTDYAIGDTILVSGETVRTIATITSNTVLTVTSAFSNTASALTFTHKSIIDDGLTEHGLHRYLIAPSDQIRIATTGGQDVYYNISKPKERPIYGSRVVYVSGMNPQLLTFSSTISSTENIVGGTLHIPAYYMPADINVDTEDGTSIIPFLDPFYAVMAVASEIAFNDITFETKAPDLAGKAQFLYNQMVRKNRRNTYGATRPIPTRVNRIRSTEVR